MDVRNSQLIIVLFLLFAMVVSLAAYFGFRNIAWRAAQLDLEWAEEDDAQSANRSAYRSRRSSQLNRQGGLSSTDQLHANKRLRDLLDQRTKALMQQQELLKQARAESQRHKAELARLRTANGQPVEEADASDPSELLSADAGPNETRVASLSEGLLEEMLPNEDLFSDTTDRTTTEPEMELAALEWELSQSQARVMELELSLLREIETTTRATEAIVDAGPPVVPALIETLSDTNPDLRRWGATVLGRMGLDATDAVEALRRATQDADAAVAAAAQSALDQIVGRY